MSRKNAGFGLIEVIVASGLFVVTAVTGITTILHSYSVNRLGGDEDEARQYAQSGIDVVRQLKEGSWSSLVLGDHGLSDAGSVWSLSGTGDSQGDYARVVTISSVNRDGGNNIVATGGTVDPDTLRVTSSVDWNFSPTRANNVELVTYLTQWDKPIGTTTFRVGEYYIETGYTGTGYSLTLSNNLASNYFVIVQGSDGSAGGNTTYGPDDNYVRLTADPSGTGDLAPSGGLNILGFSRGAAGGVGWKGVMTVVECLANCSTAGFQLLDVKSVDHVGAALTGTVNSGTSWVDINQVMLMGGYSGAGCSTSEANNVKHKSCHARIYPSGSNVVNWTRNSGGTGLATAASTVMALEWGSEWGVQRRNVTGTQGGNGANATGEYSTASINSVVRENTWVWGTGYTTDNGIGDAGEGTLITLGDGVNQNVNEVLVAAGQEYKDSKDFEIYVLTHPSLVVDYRFKADGHKNDLIYDQTVDVNASLESRMSLVYNGTNGTGNAYPRPIFSSRYLNDTTVRLERRYSGQNWPAWTMGIDYSEVGGGGGGGGGGCTIYASTDVPKTISSSGTPTITSTLSVSGVMGNTTDVNVVSLNGVHTYMGDLNFNLTSPTGTTVQVISNSCGSNNDFSLSLDDEASPGAWPCPPVGGGTYQPSNSLSAMDGVSPNGTWILTVNDTYNADGGSLNGWGVEVCD